MSITNINIIDLAVVKSLDLDLDKGMSVLTGETGAGKSILLTALGLALGDRADSGYVRPESKRAEINIEFDLHDAPSAKQWLLDHELDEDDLCLVRRLINQDGRSKAYINNRPVTLQLLQALSRLLVEIHGQHAHLTLLNSQQQMRLLDQFANNQNLLGQLNEAYKQWRQNDQELTQLIQTRQNQTEREEIIRYQLDELQQLDLDNFNYAEIVTEHQKLANMEQILSSGYQQLDLLYDNEQQSVSQLLGQSANALIELARFSPDMDEIAEQLSDAQIRVSEAAQQLRRFLESQEADPQRMEWLDNQISLIHDLSRKHAAEPENLPETARLLADELDNISHSGERIEFLTQQCHQQHLHYSEIAEQLSEQRRQAADKMAQRISDMIKELGMPQGEFKVELQTKTPETPLLNGLDSVEFLVSANPGLPPKALAKVASGGELSRISLAIQVTTSTDKTTPTMIFDEVDSGIGGGIAEIVGRKMRSLSENRQVMCVTHLPQVAAQAHQHLFVSKNNDSDVTASTVKRLSDKERIEEVARMLGGVNMTENTLAHAAEMLGV